MPRSSCEILLHRSGDGNKELTRHSGDYTYATAVHLRPSLYQIKVDY